MDINKLAFFRSAMFHGQVESPSKGLWSFLDHPDNFVLLAINNHSLHVIDYYRNVRPLISILPIISLNDIFKLCLWSLVAQRILVGARFENVRVELGWPSHHDSNPNCFPCLFIQFLQSDSRQSKMLQIFSKQAPMMDALITRFHRAKCREEEAGDEVDGAGDASSDIEGGL